MGKQLGKRRRKERHFQEDAKVIPLRAAKCASWRELPPIKAMNPTQAEYLDYMRTCPQIVGIGPAGTGKTWLAATFAADRYRKRLISKIILTRPVVPCGRSLGYFSGSMEDKFGPWAIPIVQAIQERIGQAAYDIAVRNGDIEVVPFEVMRGRSWKNAFIILDEAQNTSLAEIKMFLTRIGEDCTTVVNGDINQCDFDGRSGLKTMLDLIRQHELPVPVIEFKASDIVRSGLCGMWVRAFDEIANG